MRTTHFIGIMLSLLISANCFAQPVIYPNPSFTEVNSEETEVIAYSEVTNMSEFDRNLTWTRIVLSQTTGWTSAICDLNICHLDFVSNASFVLPAGESGTLDVHVYPAGIEGAAVYQVTVHDPTDPEFADTAFYYFNQALSASERLKENVKIYPNPVVDVLNIESGHRVRRIEIFNIEGKEMMAVRISENNTVNLSKLPPGSYILRMFDGADEEISGNLLVKQ